MTTTNADFSDLKIIFSPEGPAVFSTERIALGFINALKLEGLKDSPGVVEEYDYSSTQHPADNVRIRMVYVFYSRIFRFLVEEGILKTSLSLHLLLSNPITVFRERSLI